MFMPSRAFFLLLFAASAFAQQNLTGTWQGIVRPPDTKADLRTVIRIAAADGATYKATFYSIDQTFQAFPTTVTVQPSNIKIEIPGIGAVFEGKLSADGNTIAGSIKRGFPEAVPWTLKRLLEGQEAWNIPPPPEPRKPLHDADPSFEVDTVKLTPPDTRGMGIRLQGQTIGVVNMTVQQLLTQVYEVHTRQIIGGPAWFESEHYDITAKFEGDGQPNVDQFRIMMRKLLADRFQLVTHRDNRELAVYTLGLAKSGSKLVKSDTDKDAPFVIGRGPGSVSFSSTSMIDLARFLQGPVERPVVDHTGLAGRFDFALVWTPPEMQNANPPAVSNALGGERPDLPPDLFTAIQQQLGLKLEAVKESIDVLVIDKAEKPGGN
jgi:uncharacterized protein (TIGR03435 family)